MDPRLRLGDRHKLGALAGARLSSRAQAHACTQTLVGACGFCDDDSALGASKSPVRPDLGDRAWDLRATQAGILSPVRGLERPSSETLFTGVILTLTAIGALTWTTREAILRQPLWAVAEATQLEAFLPDMSTGQWEVLPFYYTLGAWPRTYAGKPVFYTAPYAKGPPSRFAGRITARWDEPGTRLTFEGPRTPAPINGAHGSRHPRERIKACLLTPDITLSCLRVRESSLQRHLTEMQERLTGQANGGTGPQLDWKLRWFAVKNSGIPTDEQAQGLWLSASFGERGEERYVIITENGTHQTMILDLPIPGPADHSSSQRSAAAALARKTIEQAIRSLRASDDLTSGRAWIDRELTQSRLDSIDPTAPPEQVVPQLAQIQAQLMAKITVDPAVFETYFHLGGTGLLLSQYARRAASSARGPSATHALELGAVAKGQIQSALRYAQDLAPKDPRTTQVQGFLLEAQKN